MNLSMDWLQKSTIGRAHPAQILNRLLSAVAPGLAARAAEQLFVTVVRHTAPAREKGWAEGAEKTSIPTPHGDLAAWVWATDLRHQSRVGGVIFSGVPDRLLAGGTPAPQLNSAGLNREEV